MTGCVQMKNSLMHTAQTHYAENIFRKGMNQAGLKNVQVHLLPNARHDLLHEEKSGNAKKAIDVLIKWMDE